MCFKCKHVDFLVPFDRALHFVKSVIYNQQPEALIPNRCRLNHVILTTPMQVIQCSRQFGQDTVFILYHEGVTLEQCLSELKEQMGMFQVLVERTEGLFSLRLTSKHICFLV